jgi:hypothetical protein
LCDFTFFKNTIENLQVRMKQIQYETRENNNRDCDVSPYIQRGCLAQLETLTTIEVRMMT